MMGGPGSTFLGGADGSDGSARGGHDFNGGLDTGVTGARTPVPGGAKPITLPGGNGNPPA